MENAPAAEETIRMLLELISLENILSNIWPDNENKPEKQQKKSNKKSEV